MDVVLSANRESPLASTLQQQLQSDLSYRVSKNYSNLSTQVVKLSPNIAPSGNPHSKTLDFLLPRYGLLKNLVIESVLTTAGNNTASSNLDLGERVFNFCELRSHNKSIAQNTAGYIKVRGKQEPVEIALGQSYITNAPANFSANSITVYTPLYFSFTDNIYNALDLTFCENISLHCEINTQAGMGLNAVLSAGVFNCYMRYYNLDTPAHKKLIDMNFKPERPLTMLSYDVTEEVFALTDSTTSTTVDLKTNNLCHSIHFFIRDTATAELNPITSYSFQASGRTIRDNIPEKLSTYYSALRGNSNATKITAVAKTDSVSGTIEHDMTVKCNSIYFGLDRSRDWNSGSISLQNINNAQLSVNYASASSDELVVIYEYWTLISINSSNGVVDRGLNI